MSALRAGATLQLGAKLDSRRLQVDALLFDLGGTLDADGLGWSERFEALLREQLPATTPGAMAAALAAGEQRVLLHPRAAELGLEEMISLHVRMQLEQLGASSPLRAARLVKVFYEETSGALARRRPLLERLAQRIPLGVVSNGCGNTERLLRECGLAELLHSIVDSSLAKVWKPDPRIFAPALAALGLAPGRVAMAGDRLDRDVAAAAAAGLHAIWVSGGRSLDPAHPCAPAVELLIESVDDLDPGDER